MTITNIQQLEHRDGLPPHLLATWKSEPQP